MCYLRNPLNVNQLIHRFNIRSDLGLGLILRDEGLQKPHVQHAELSLEADGNRDTKVLKCIGL